MDTPRADRCRRGSCGNSSADSFERINVGGSPMNRRLVIALILFFAGTLAFAQAQQFTLKQIAPNVYAAIANPTGSAGGNAGFVIGDDGVLVVDTFTTVEAANQMLAEIRRL